MARATGFEAQRKAIGAEQTALVAALREVGTGNVKIVPDIQVGGQGGVIDGLGALLMRSLAEGHDNGAPTTTATARRSIRRHRRPRPTRWFDDLTGHGRWPTTRQEWAPMTEQTRTPRSPTSWR